jgi:hypothetical protein
MLTYEDITGYFLKAASSVTLMTHPEHWTNSRSLEREFACTCHSGSCEEAENRSTCTISFTWGTLDTALSLDGPVGICDFFHEPELDCPHLHTRDIPPLVIDLSYSLPLNDASISDTGLLSLMQMLKLRASEHSGRATETRPGITMALHDSRLQPEAITLQQRVELPIWHPDGMRGLRDLQDNAHYPVSGRFIPRRHRQIDEDEDEDEEEVVADNPRPEEWLPEVMVEVCEDILQVLEALDAVRSQGQFNLG